MLPPALAVADLTIDTRPQTVYRAGRPVELDLTGRWRGAARIARWAARHRRWLTITPREVDAAYRWFGRHGGTALLVGRLLPAVRTLISVPAGVARMASFRFLALFGVGWLA